jgi:hypothetical protein
LVNDEDLHGDLSRFVPRANKSLSSAIVKFLCNQEEACLVQGFSLPKQKDAVITWSAQRVKQLGSVVSGIKIAASQAVVLLSFTGMLTTILVMFLGNFSSLLCLSM